MEKLKIIEIDGAIKKRGVNIVKNNEKLKKH